MIYIGNFKREKQYYGSIKEAKQELNFEIVEATKTPPITYVGSGEDLINYRIYGNTQTINQVEVSVGNYQNGQYRIPISITHASTISPINIDLPYPLRKVGTEYEYIDYGNQKMYRKRKNLLEPVNDSSGYPYGVPYNISNGTILLNGTADRTTELVKTNFKKAFYMPTCLDDGGTGVLHFCNSAAADVTVSFLDYYANPKFSVTLDEPNKIVTKYPTGGLQTLWISIGIVEGATYSNLVIEPMLCNGITTVTDFEPYIADDDLTLDVTLPVIPTYQTDNVLSFNTTVQPSQMYLKGKIII